MWDGSLGDIPLRGEDGCKRVLVGWSLLIDWHDCLSLLVGLCRMVGVAITPSGWSYSAGESGRCSFPYAWLLLVAVAATSPRWVVFEVVMPVILFRLVSFHRLTRPLLPSGWLVLIGYNLTIAPFLSVGF